MGWTFVTIATLAAFALIWRYGKLPRSAIELSAAVLLVGMAGYAWQGSPGQRGQSAQSREAAPRFDPALVTARKSMMGQFGNEAQWLDFADAMLGMGETQGAVLAMRSGIRDNPKSANLWVGLGNALVAHGNGLVSPAARFAFQHAAALSPLHPAPPYFMGIALAQEGKTEEAARIWIGLLARSPKNAAWVPDVEARLMAIGVRLPKAH